MACKRYGGHGSRDGSGIARDTRRAMLVGQASPLELRSISSHCLTLTAFKNEAKSRSVTRGRRFLITVRFHGMSHCV